MLGGVLDVWGAHWELQYLCGNLVDSQVSVSAEAPTLEEYKHSTSVQSLLLLLRLVDEKKQEHKSLNKWGANAQGMVGLHQI